MNQVKKKIYVKSAILFTIINILFFSNQLNAKPTFEWTPKKLILEQMLARRSTHKMSVKASKDVDGAIINIVPELKDWITVSPYFFNNIKKGETINLTVIISLPYNIPLETVEGVIQLREAIPGKPGKTLAKPLPVVLKVIEGNDEGLPPHPGNAGKLTVLGVDSDNDGVRDDVQIAISHRYQDDVNARFASREFAKAMQSSLIAYELKDTNLIYDSFEQTYTAVFRLGNLSEFMDEDIALIEMLMQNTPERLNAYLSVSEYMVGQTYRSTYDTNEEIEDRK